MKRAIILSGDIIVSNNEVVIELKNVDIVNFILSFDLLINKISPKIYMLIEKYKLVFSIGDLSHIDLDSDKKNILISLSIDSIEYIHMIFLNAYSNNTPNLDHIHIECMNRLGCSFDLTFIFGRHIIYPINIS